MKFKPIVRLRAVYESLISRSNVYQAMKTSRDEKNSKISKLKDRLEAESELRVQTENQAEGLEAVSDYQAWEISTLRSKLEKEGRYKKDAQRLAGQFLREKRKATDLEKKLSKETNEKELQIKLGTMDLEEFLRKKYRQGVNEAYNLCVRINNLMKGEMKATQEELKVIKKQLELAKGGYGFKDIEVRELRRQSLEALEPFEEATGLKKGTALYINPRLRVVYGTPGFFDKFTITREELYSGGISRLFSYLDEESRKEIMSYTEERFAKPKKFDLSVEGAIHSIKIIPHKLEDRDRNHIGTWLEFEDTSKGFWGKLFSRRNKKEKNDDPEKT